jgi:hypothetical protein
MDSVLDHRLCFLHLLFGSGKRFMSFNSAASAEAAIQSLNNATIGGHVMNLNVTVPI